MRKVWCIKKIGYERAQALKVVDFLFRDLVSTIENQIDTILFISYISLGN